MSIYNGHDMTLARTVAIDGLSGDRILAAANYGCAAWVDSRDSFCGHKPHEGMLCKRHHGVAVKRLAAEVERSRAKAEADRAKDAAMLPRWREELAALEQSIETLESRFSTTMERAAIGGAVHPRIRKKQMSDMSRDMKTWRQLEPKIQRAETLRRLIARAGTHNTEETP